MIDAIGIARTLITQAAAPSRTETSSDAANLERPADPPVSKQGGTLEPPPIQPGQLQLDIDRTTGRVVGRIIDKESGATITQIPSEEALRMIAVSQRLLGAVIDRKL
jgi:hypothetical protein